MATNESKIISNYKHHPTNPSMQCSVCGQWKRLTGKDGIQNFYPVCGENDDIEHQKPVCTICCTHHCPYRKK